MAELSTKSGIFETGTKDEHGVAYKDGRVVGSYDKHLAEYTVKDGTVVICDRAFYDKKELRQLHLPSSVRAIGESAFAGCKVLESVNIPEGVTEIKTSTFRDCKSLRRLELPASCTKIDKWAFTDGIETLVCNAEAMQIDKWAFLSCKTLKTVLVPEGCINAYIQAFLPCGFMPQFEEMKEEHIAEASIDEEELEEEIFDDDTFEDEDVLEDGTDSINKEEEDNNLLTNKKELLMESIIERGEISLPEEFMTIRHFTGTEDGDIFIQSYPGLVKDGNYYYSGDNLNEVTSDSDFKSYDNPEVFDEVYEIPETIKTLEELADWILDDWADLVIDDGYDVVNHEFAVDFWKDSHVFYSKKTNKR